MKKSINLDFLLNKFLDGKSTSEEKYLLYELVKSSENENILKESLYKKLNEFDENQFMGTNSVDFSQIYGNILEEIRKKDSNENRKPGKIQKPGFKRIIFYGLSLAAVSVIAFFLGSLSHKSSDAGVQKQVAVVTYNEITAPYGSKSELILPDSSHVILNAGSTIRYRSDFNLNNRDINLVGEAYFKVAKNAGLPLIVTAGNLNVKAIGTEFNIKAYHDESFIETTLIEGKVEISQLDAMETSQFVDLNPNQKAIYIKEADSYKLEKVQDLTSPVKEPVKTIYDNILISPKVDVSQVVAWTKGKLIIKGESLDNLCIELQRKYDVSFVLTDEEIKKYRFTGVLLDETLEQVMNVIKLTAPIVYQVKGKTVILSSDKTQLNDYSPHLK